MKKTLAALVMIATCSGAFAQDTASLAQPKVTVSPGSGTTTVYWTSRVYSGSHHPYITYLATLMKGQPIRPMVTLDFRDVEKRLGECKEIAWSVDGKRVAPASQQYSADEPHKRTVQSLSFIFSVDALASMISAETKADVCGESFMMDAYAAKALELFVAQLRQSDGPGK
jgi:hypothetical protein